MSQVGAPRGRTCSGRTCPRTFRSVALLTTGVLALPVLSGCSSDHDNGNAAAVDISPAARESLAQGGTLKWAVDTVPATLNAFQADADATTERVAGAVLPSLFTLDKNGAPKVDSDYVESAKIVGHEPKQVVEYKLNQAAVWSDGREIGAPDFLAQWQALRGRNSAFWTARNAGYDRIEKIQRGKDDLDVKITFSKPYADWKSLFTPLYPKDVMATPSAFNDGARAALKTTAGPFQVKSVDRKKKETTLVRNAHWWGKPAKLDSIVLRAVPMDARATQLAAGGLDVADVDTGVAERVSSAAGPGGVAASPSGGPRGAQGAQGQNAAKPNAKERAEEARRLRAAKAATAAQAAKLKGDELAAFRAEQKSLKNFSVRKSLEPAYTQLAMNGETGPLADDRVRRAVARAINRQKLADTVLKPLGLPAKTLGSHLAVAGQPAYADASDALGKPDAHEAQALLADAGWTPEGAREVPKNSTKAGSEGKKTDADADGKKADEKKADEKKGSAGSKTDDATKAGKATKSGEPDAKKSGEAKKSDAGKDEKQSDEKKPDAGKSGGSAADDKPAEQQPGGMAGAYAPRGTAVPTATASATATATHAAGTAAKGGPLGKDGRPLTLRFVLPAGPGSEQLRTVGTRIGAMLEKVGIKTEITKVPDSSFFKDYIASGSYDLALYSWPASAYPATDGRPIYAKPQPAADGSLMVEQNYTRVGTDRINQLFDQATGELDQGKEDALLKQADARIWAAAGSIPLYQRPQLVAAKNDVRNVGAFGFQTPRYQDIGFTTLKGHSGAEAEKATAKADASAKAKSKDTDSGDEDSSGDDGS
ncbi:ABC transporter family substrate-binding protein [Streptomyces fuscigenes]|uniref:ABC transporter family substrate-binding protein n=1 Tax=Streptomyces fuscigenes TaxID=1528880 RepID=UPI001F1DF1CB|nr:ABC transporter family substrate-binding protein [Streptomyces fuscigenes]MCF3962035.1 ABC transporter substrate-binding protein [Streptomyces fuscigenes]